MTASLTERQRQLLALAIMVLVVAIMMMLTVVPLWAVNRHYHDTIDALDSRLKTLQYAAAAGDGLRSQHEQLKRSLANNRHYLKSASEALAAADLQGIIKRIAGASSMEVLSTQILPTSEVSDFTRIALRVRMRGKLDNLLKVFYKLETGLPYLFLDNVSVRSQGQRRRTVNADYLLDVDFDLIGYMPRES
jgi:general secretion pathway protein M